jgi:predicted outer membrane protein
MSKKIALLVVFTFLVGGTALTQQQDKTTDRQGQTTNSKQDTKTQSDKMSSMSQGDMKIASDDKHFVMKAAESGMEEVEMGQLALRQASSEEVKQFAQRMIDDHSKANSELMQLAQRKGIMLPETMNSGTVDNMNSSGQTSPGSATGQQSSGSSASGQSSSRSTNGQQSNATGQQTNGTTGQQNNRTGTTGQQNDRTGSGQQNDRIGSMASGQDSGTAMKGSADHQKMMNKMGKLSGADFDREYMKQQVADHDKAVSLFEKQSKNGKDSELRSFADRTLPTLKEHQQTARDLNSRVGGKSDSSSKNPK